MRLFLLLIGLAIAAAVQAQPYPSHPVKIIVPSPPGGPPDLIARMIAPKMQPILGQPLVVENRAGAGGIVGTAYLAKLPPDGYNWLITTASHTNTPPFNDNVPFDPVRDFAHVTLVAQNFGQALIVPAGSPFHTVKELIDFARANPGKLNYGSAGIGTASHIPAELMKSMAGVDIVGVQYRGVAEVMTDILSGRMDMFFVGTQVAASQAKAGKVRVLALTGLKRWKGLPEVPTMQEAGFKGFNLINWFGLWLPAGASPQIVSQIHGVVVKALADPEIKAQFDQQGLEGVGMPPAEFAKFVEKESVFINDLARKIQKK
ncbi:MAG TPA: tripartite tricarboxylate transporter substrate binding protein [Burkholderiales bacterium]